VTKTRFFPITVLVVVLSLVWGGPASAAAPTVPWMLAGNAGTNPATSFLGTTDNVDLVLRTNSQERLRVLNTGTVRATVGFAGSGAELTSLNAANLASGTVADARLSANVVLADSAQAVTGLR
jgi:hypothetical protein